MAETGPFCVFPVILVFVMLIETGGSKALREQGGENLEEGNDTGFPEFHYGIVG